LSLSAESRNTERQAEGNIILKAIGQSSLFLASSFSKQPLKLRQGLKAPKFRLVLEFFRRVSVC
jgi:hypothetical protein